MKGGGYIAYVIPHIPPRIYAHARRYSVKTIIHILKVFSSSRQTAIHIKIHSDILETRTLDWYQNHHYNTTTTHTHLAYIQPVPVVYSAGGGGCDRPPPVVESQVFDNVFHCFCKLHFAIKLSNQCHNASSDCLMCLYMFSACKKLRQNAPKLIILGTK